MHSRIFIYRKVKTKLFCKKLKIETNKKFGNLILQQYEDVFWKQQMTHDLEHVCSLICFMVHQLFSFDYFHEQKGLLSHFLNNDDLFIEIYNFVKRLKFHLVIFFLAYIEWLVTKSKIIKLEHMSIKNTYLSSNKHYVDGLCVSFLTAKNKV